MKGTQILREFARHSATVTKFLNLRLSDVAPGSKIHIEQTQDFVAGIATS
jgi:hypothetical protein